MYQNRYGSLIGQSKREATMIGQIGILKRLVGKSLNAFLSECRCGTTRSRNDQCKDLQQYEASPYVTFRGNQLSDSGDSSFPKLSTFYSQFANDLIDEIKIYFPGEGEKNKVPSINYIDRQGMGVSKISTIIYKGEGV